jgi:DNA (cytosine-5)-methyltransferase 1
MSTKQLSLSNLVRLKTAASLFGVSPQTIRNWVAQGQLSAIRHPVNGYRLFNVQELNRLLKTYSIQTPGQRDLFPPIAKQTTPEIVSVISAPGVQNATQASSDIGWLRLTESPVTSAPRKKLNVGDAFCGGGIFSLGVTEGLRQVGVEANHIFGIDFEKDAIDTYAANHPHSRSIHADITSIVNGSPGSKTTPAERKFTRDLQNGIDILVGGPPCQGHSDLNNHTRRNDPKNKLYLSMARLAEVLRPAVVIIENVPGAVKDKDGVVSQTELELNRLGYEVVRSTIDLSQVGVPQKRKRFVLVGTNRGSIDISLAISAYRNSIRSVSWALEDLVHIYDSADIYNSSANHSVENKRRIKYLFEHGLYELPNEERPACHRDKAHSYKSVYGRMHWEQPSPTITGGFGSTGQGRFVHPLFPRTITPHEACRLQFIPDFFSFPRQVGRRSMQQIIGNAAPPRLSWVLMSALATQGLLP